MNLISAMIGFLVALFGIYIAQRVGLLQVSIAHKEHDLNLRKASPIIGSAVTLAERQILYSIRSERLLMEEMDYNLLFRWFVGLNADDEVWDATSFAVHATA